MSKKYFIPFFIIGSLLIFSLLALFNYHIDQYRVLHTDYETFYQKIVPKQHQRDKYKILHPFNNGIEPNTTYLKVSYLLKNLDHYDTLLMGSSRTGNMDGKKISNHAYNLAYSLGNAAIHLKNLKVLLKENSSIKNIWMGINDYEIWNDPTDRYTNFLRRCYEETWLGKIAFYQFYLFKKPSDRDMDIWSGKYTLTTGEHITNTNNIEEGRRNEKKVHSDPRHKSFIQKMPPTSTKDSNKPYRISQTIQEIKEIKTLCDKHNITLTLFMYPSIYITYMAYNQSKIEMFKRALSKVSPFHDFYRLDAIALDEENWFDTSHFVPSIGDYIITHIQNHTHLVNQDTIEDDLKEVQKLEIKQYKALQEKTLFRIPRDQLLCPATHKIFDLHNPNAGYYKINQLEIHAKRFSTNHNDPIILLNQLRTKAKFVVLRYVINSPHDTSFELFYRENKDDAYTANLSFSANIEKGDNHILVSIPAKYINNDLRVDLVSKAGSYTIKAFSIMTPNN